MKTRNLMLLAAFTFIGGAIVFNACKKDNSGLNSETVALASEEAAVSAALDDAMAEVDDLEVGSGTKAAEVTCKDVKLVTKITDWPRVVTVDFGTGCTGKTGRTKSGKIKVTFGGLTKYKLWAAGNYRIIEFEDFKVNGRKIEGTKTVTYMGLNNDSLPYWTIKLEDGKITFRDSTFITREYEHTRTMTAGFDSTSKRVDGVFELTGNGSGTTRKGLSFTDEIIEPLTFDHNCRHIKTGSVKITVEGKDPIVITYENEGNCSGKYTIEQNGQTEDATDE